MNKSVNEISGRVLSEHRRVASAADPYKGARARARVAWRELGGEFHSSRFSAQLK